MKLEKTALDRGWTDRISLTLIFNPLRVMLMTYTHKKNFKVNSQLVLKTEWKQTDGWRRLHAIASVSFDNAASKYQQKIFALKYIVTTR